MEKTVVVENILHTTYPKTLQIQIPPQQRMDIYEPPPPSCQTTVLEYQIQQTKAMMAHIESKGFREEGEYTKEQHQKIISFYTSRFRELLLRRHAIRGEHAFILKPTG